MIIKLLLLFIFLDIIYIKNVNGRYYDYMDVPEPTTPEPVVLSPAELVAKLVDELADMRYSHSYIVFYIANTTDDHDRFQKLFDRSKIIFSSIDNGRTVLKANKFVARPTDFSPKKEEVMNALNNVLFNTILYAKLVIRIPKYTAIMMQHFGDWMRLYNYGRDLGNSLHIVDNKIKQTLTNASLQLQANIPKKGVASNPTPFQTGLRETEYARRKNTKEMLAFKAEFRHTIQKIKAEVKELKSFDPLDINLLTTLHKTATDLYLKMKPAYKTLKYYSFVPGATQFPPENKIVMTALNDTLCCAVLYATFIQEFPKQFCFMLFGNEEWRVYYTYAYKVALKTNLLNQETEKLIMLANLDMYIHKDIELTILEMIGNAFTSLLEMLGIVI